jgi:hypothetical protein
MDADLIPQAVTAVNPFLFGSSGIRPLKPFSPLQEDPISKTAPGIGILPGLWKGLFHEFKDPSVQLILSPFVPQAENRQLTLERGSLAVGEAVF